MNVAAWLHGLGLGQYEQAFRENDIDAAFLADQGRSISVTGDCERSTSNALEKTSRDDDGKEQGIHRSQAMAACFVPRRAWVASASRYPPVPEVRLLGLLGVKTGAAMKMPKPSPTIRSNGGNHHGDRLRWFSSQLGVGRCGLRMLMWPHAGTAYTPEQRQAPRAPDAMQLCFAHIPDVDRIKACMIRNKSQLSPACRARSLGRGLKRALRADRGFWRRSRRLAAEDTCELQCRSVDRIRRYAPKYRNPDRPSETGAGRGKQPRWPVEQLGVGKRIDDFRFKKAPSALKLAQIAYGLLPRDVFIPVEQPTPGNFDLDEWVMLRRAIELIQQQPTAPSWGLPWRRSRTRFRGDQAKLIEAK